MTALIATADTRTWIFDEEALFLGEWCRRAEDESVWSKMNARVLPYHWDDRAKVYADYLELERLYEATLPQLAQVLNDLHSTKFSVRYWRMVAGYALRFAMSVLWDRLTVMRDAVDAGGDRIRCIDGGVEALVAGSTSDLMDAAAASHVWNQILFEALAEQFPIIRKEHVAANDTLPWRAANSPGRLRRVRWAASRLTRIFSGPVVFVQGGISGKDTLRLHFAARQIPFVWPQREIPVARPDIGLRQSIRLRIGENPFEQVVSRFFPYFLPTALVENYRSLRDGAMHTFPRKPRRIVTTQFGDPAFTLWAAEQQADGAEVCVIQHGGHDGVDRWSDSEQHDLLVADRYFSWGWTKPGYANIDPKPSPKLSTLPDIRPEPTGGLLCIYDAAFPYAYRMYSLPIAGQRRDDNTLQIRLLHGLPPDILQKCNLRLHRIDDGFGFRQEIEKLGMKGLVDNTGRNLIEALRASRLCLIASNSTPILEVLSANFPSVLFWDHLTSELRPEAIPYYSALHDANILASTPEAAANHIASVWHDPTSWWRAERTQAARRFFIDRFARRSSSWLEEWSRVLRSDGG